AAFYLRDEPLESPIHDPLDARTGVEQNLNGQRGFLDAGWNTGAATPAAVRILHRDEPADALAGAFAVHHIEVAVSGQNASGAVGRILVAGGVLVAEPERQPGAVGALL